MLTFIVVAAFWFNSVLGQVVQTGLTDPDYCYKIVTIRPNLRLQALKIVLKVNTTGQPDSIRPIR